MVEYNATDGDFQGESQKLGRHTANSHLVGRDRAYGPQRCRVYYYAPRSIYCVLWPEGYELAWAIIYPGILRSTGGMIWPLTPGIPASTLMVDIAPGLGV